MHAEIILIGYIGDKDFDRLHKVLINAGITVGELFFGDKMCNYLLDWKLTDAPTLRYKREVFSRETFDKCSLIFVKWWHMGTPDLIDYKDENPDYEQFTKHEWEASLKCFLSYYYHFAKNKWIGGPINNANSNLKQFLLNIAHTTGFNIPSTFISNKHQTYTEGKKWVSKAIGKNQSISANEEFYTTKISEAFITKYIKDKVLNTPSLIQEQVLKSYEVRIFFINNRIISVKIKSDGDHVDSRYRQKLSAEPFELSDELHQKIIRLCKIISIDYFALDILFDEQHLPWMVDITPEASWFYYETEDMELSKTIASILLNK